MSTAYYVKIPRETICMRCGSRTSQPNKLHLGTSSGGWCFALNVIELEFESLNDWKHALCIYPIVDEYDEEISYDRMISIITDRGPASWSDEDLRTNEAVRGPNGLARLEVDGRHCIGHGEGTWYYVLFNE